MSLPESEWRLGAAVACAEEEVQSDSTAMVLVRPMVQSDSIGRWRIAGLATATRRATGVASLAPSLADDLSSIWKQWKGAHTNRTDRAPTQVRPQPRLDRVSSTPPKLWAIQAHPPAPGYLQGPTRRCRGGSCARVRRRRRPTPVAAHRPRSSERAGRAARSGQMRCGPRASAVRVGPHGPAWGARAGTERTELLRAVASYFVQYVDRDRH